MGCDGARRGLGGRYSAGSLRRVVDGRRAADAAVVGSGVGDGRIRVPNGWVALSDLSGCSVVTLRKSLRSR
eukprot:69474-Rhodomonas_salina.6